MLISSLDYGQITLRVTTDECTLLITALQAAYDALILLPLPTLDDHDLAHLETITSLLTTASRTAESPLFPLPNLAPRQIQNHQLPAKNKSL